MRRKHRILLGVVIVAFAFPTLVPTVHAREKVTCTFTIQEDASRNVKAGKYSETEKVRRREYNRLVQSGED
jgi:hypothetical protein